MPMALAAAVMAAPEVVEVKAETAAQADRRGKSLSSSTRWPLAAKFASMRWVDAVVMVGPAVLEVSEARAGQREKHVVFVEVPAVAAFQDSKDL